MKVNIARKPTKMDRKELIAAAEFYAGILLSKRLAANITLDIEFNDLRNQHCDAMCNWEDSNTRPRWFTIQLDQRMGRRKVLINLAHEMVHVKQHATGEAKNDMRNSNLHIWQGKVVDEDKIDYFDLPWEVDAFGRENGLYERFIANQRAAKRMKAAKSRKKRVDIHHRPVIMHLSTEE
jgi:hypothetical protein